MRALTWPFCLFHVIALTGAASMLCACPDDTPPDGDACAAPTSAGTEHPYGIDADETWSAADSPHLVADGATIAAGVTVTVEPCSVVQLGTSENLRILGSLIARGDATHPIAFAPADSGARFGQIGIEAPGTADLAFVTITGGGSATSHGAALVVQGDAVPVATPLAVDHVTVDGSAGTGVELVHWAGFAPGSTDLTITGSGAELVDRPYPMQISLNAVGTIPAGSYTGNARDEIQVVGESPHYQAEVDDTWHDRGVPYHMGGNGAFGQLEIVTPATLTIESGVTIGFDSTDSNVGFLRVRDGGELVAHGTADQPVVFTSGAIDKASGDWEGLVFDSVGPATSLSFVTLEYGGGFSGASGFGCHPNGTPDSLGLLLVFAEPPGAFITDSHFAHSAAHGIYRAWSGSSVDLTANNTFEDLVACEQVLNKDSDGNCPTDPTCQ